MITAEQGAFHLSGPLTIATVSESLRLSAPFFAQQGPWELNLAGVEEVDSAAVSLLLEWARQARRRGCDLRIRNLSDNLQCLLKVYGLQELLTPAQP